ncbi:hypothetical protein [Marinicrinis sediminis]|uniref:Uncharacterized protein n=1 Tax=Marinicrinis sediminis TaxID=1652465 RepID=A0ABW5RDZ1_9BACL
MKTRNLLISMGIAGSILVTACGGTDSNLNTQNLNQVSIDADPAKKFPDPKNVPVEMDQASDEEMTNDTAELSETDVRMEGQVTLNDDRLLIEGLSNLMPGAILIAEATLKGSDWVSEEGSAQVNPDGSFSIRLDKPELEEGQIDLYVRFRPADQADDVKLRYGSEGEELEGDLISSYEEEDTTLQQVQVSAQVDLSEEAPSVPLTAEMESDLP